MGKFRKILDILMDKDKKSQIDAVQDAEVIEDPVYEQSNGTMVSVDAKDVVVTVASNSKDVQVSRRPPIDMDSVKMGGEEIKAGTLH